MQQDIPFKNPTVRKLLKKGPLVDSELVNAIKRGCCSCEIPRVGV